MAGEAAALRARALDDREGFWLEAAGLIDWDKAPTNALGCESNRTRQRRKCCPFPFRAIRIESSPLDETNRFLCGKK